MKLIFWQPIPSFHQEGLLYALASKGYEVVLRVENELPPERKNMGWREAVFPGVRVEKILPEQVPEPHDGVVHLFTGFGSHPGIWYAFRRLSAGSACRCFAYTEAPDFSGAWGILRRWKYQIAAGRLSPRLDGVLATGRCAVNFYRSLNGIQCPVHEFGYFDGREKGGRPYPCTFSPGESLDREKADMCGLPFSILIAGQLIRRKGVDLLFRALTDLQELDWRLRIAGAGPEQKRLLRLAARLGIQDRLTWLGVLSRRGLTEEYRKARALFLPSRFEGWGMTVNEALRAGCPVRVSTMAGAASLVPEAWRMEPTVDSIRESLHRLITEDNPEEESRMALQYARQTTGDVGVERLLKILG